ncbi:DUF3103 family protein [Streptomyces sp. NPDC048718]|uniref:DUF3103 family protein n=1 Tax=Streptomyces sp. NPDC048718 TaxID=3365587 RepID=UPI0037236CCC
MRSRPTRRPRTLAATAATLVALCAAQTLSVASAATAAPAPAPSHDRVAGAASAHSRTATRAAVTSAQDRAAKAVARSLGDAAWNKSLRAAALKSGEVPLAAKAPGALKTQLAAADRDIARAKGLDAKTGSLLELRLGDESMRSALRAGEEPWVAAAVADDGLTTVTAYDSRGVAHRLDAAKAPARPVYVVDVDGEKALAAGLDVMREEFNKAGVPSAGPGAVNTTTTAPQSKTAGVAGAAAAGYWSTKITAVHLKDDKEPWIKGGAEIYSLVSGFGQDGKVRVDPVTMPYIKDDGVVYYPNQLLVNWSNYKYNLADVVMMEEDGSTNYRDLAKAIATVLLTITDQGAYIPLVNAILDAIPDSWWTDDPDYVDSWYTLAKQSKGTLYGASNNGYMTVEPYFVSQL